MPGEQERKRGLASERLSEERGRKRDRQTEKIWIQTKRAERKRSTVYGFVRVD